MLQSERTFRYSPSLSIYRAPIVNFPTHNTFPQYTSQDTRSKSEFQTSSFHPFLCHHTHTNSPDIPPLLLTTPMCNPYNPSPDPPTRDPIHTIPPLSPTHLTPLPFLTKRATPCIYISSYIRQHIRYTIFHSPQFAQDKITRIGRLGV
jgi:hypothetical protein